MPAPASTGTPSPPTSRILEIWRIVASATLLLSALARAIDLNSDRRYQMSSWASHIFSEVIACGVFGRIVRSSGTVERSTRIFCGSSSCPILSSRVVSTGSSSRQVSSICFS